MNGPKHSFRMSSHATYRAGMLVLWIVGLAPALPAATLTWDASGTNPTAAVDGAGTWDTASAKWSNAAADILWPNTSADIAVFGKANGAAGSVTVGTVTANGITFNAPGSGAYTLSGGSITLAGTTPTLTFSATTSTISSAITGSAGLKAAGTSTLKTLILSGTNTYSGGTTLTGGSLKINTTASALQGATTLSGGTLVLNAGNATYANAFSGSAPITVFTGNAGVSFTGDMSGYTGTVDLNPGSAASKTSFTTTQATLISASATLKVEAGTTLHLNQALNYAAKIQLFGVGNNENAGALRLENGATQTGTVTLAGNTYIGNTTTSATLSGAIGQSGGTYGFTKQGAGLLTLTGANTYGGTTVVGAGTLALSGAGTLGASTAALTLSGGALDLGNLSRTLGVVSITAAAAGGDTLQNGSLSGTSYAVSNPTGTAVISANLLASAAAGLVKTGAGSLTLSGTNTYTGATTLSAGTLSAGTSANLGAAAANLVFNGGTLQLTGTALTGFSTLGHTVSFAADAAVGLDINSAANTFSIDQVLNQASGAFTKSGAGTAVTSLDHTYGGSTSVSAGKLLVSGGSITTAAVNSDTTNQVLVGTTSGVPAALYQSGSSTITSNNTNGGAFAIGSAVGVWGYYNLSSGTINLAGEINVGGTHGGAGTFAQFDMSGGTVNLPTSNGNGAYFLPNRGAAGEASVVNIAGGTVQIAGGSSAVADGNFNGLALNWSNSGAAQTATFTLSGSGQFLTPTLRVKLNEGQSFTGITGNTANVAALNLSSGGLLQTLGFLNGSSPNVSINFSGGTLKAGAAANAAFLSGLGSVNIYAPPSGTNTIDNNGQEITLAQAISSASGTGVTAVAFTPGSGYVTPPQVTFSGGTLTGGNGSAATGFATIDPVSGALTGIVISNPGTYASTSGLSVALGGGGGTGASLGAITTSANTGGNLTFSGTAAGATTLTGASGFAGNIEVTAAGKLIANRSDNLLNPTTSALGNNQVARSITVSGGATLQFNSGDTLGGATSTLATTLVIEAGGTVTNGGLVFNRLGSLILNGGTLTSVSGATGGYQTYSFGSNAVVTVGGTSASTIATFGANNGIHLNTNTEFNVANATGDAAADLTVAAPLIDRNLSEGGAGGLTKSGPGTLVLSGANTYTGNTTVTEGTLTLTSACLSNASTLSIAGGGVLHLDYAGSNPVGTLILAGVTQVNGTYGAANSGGLITGSGNIQVGALSGFAAWAALNAPGQSPSQDYDLDGVANGIEYFMGETGSSLTANPGVVHGTVTWPKSASFNGTYAVQTSPDLVTWSAAAAGEVNDTGSQVIFTLPATAGHLFIRLEVTPTP